MPARPLPDHQNPATRSTSQTGQGVGYGLAQHFGECGAAIVIADYNSDAALRVEMDLREAGCRAIAVVGDVRDRGDINRVVNRG